MFVVETLKLRYTAILRKKKRLFCSLYTPRFSQGNCSITTQQARTNQVIKVLVFLKIFENPASVCHLLIEHPSVYAPGGSGEWGVLLGILGGGVCRPVLHILTLCQTKKCNFPRLLSHQTYKIYTRYCSDPTFRQKF